MTFCPTLIALMTAGLVGLRSQLVPVTGKVGRRINDHRAAAVLDPQQGVNVRREQMLGSPDRMIRRAGPSAPRPGPGKALSSDA